MSLIFGNCIFRNFFLVIAAGLISGCAEKQILGAQRLALDETACAESISVIPAKSVVRVLEGKSPAKKLSTFKFEEIARCLKTKSDNIPVVLFSLDGKVPSELHLVVKIERSGAFAAAADLLDAEFKFVRTVPFTRFTRRGGAYTLTEFLNASDAVVRYVVLRPDPSAFGKNDATIVGVTNQTPIVLIAGAVAYYGNFVSGSELQASRWLSETGSFQVWIDDYTLETRKQ